MLGSRRRRRASWRACRLLRGSGVGGGRSFSTGLPPCHYPHFLLWHRPFLRPERAKYESPGGRNTDRTTERRSGSTEARKTQERARLSGCGVGRVSARRSRGRSERIEAELETTCLLCSGIGQARLGRWRTVRVAYQRPSFGPLSPEPGSGQVRHCAAASAGGLKPLHARREKTVAASWTSGVPASSTASRNGFTKPNHPGFRAHS